MKVLRKKVATVAIAILAAGTIAMATSVSAPPAPAREIRLTAQTSPLPFQSLAQQSGNLSTALTAAVQGFLIPPSAGQAPPTPPGSPPVVAPTSSLGSFIINTYNAVEPWVRYGFELAAYAVGWVPYVGWLSPQIIIFYNFGERITRSIAYNVGYWLNGQISFGQGLYNVGVDTINSFIQLGIDQWNFWLPPLPPLPPFPFSAAQAQQSTTTAPTIVPVTGQTTGLSAEPASKPLVRGTDTAGPGRAVEPTGKTSPSIDIPNGSRKIDPFSVTTSAVSQARATTTPPGGRNPRTDVLSDPTNTVIGTTSSSGSNPSLSPALGKIRIPGPNK
jgi:hypothetical protein